MLPRAPCAVMTAQFKSRVILPAMSLIQEALRAGHSPAPQRRAVGPRVLVVGGAGALGSAVLEQLLAARHFAQVSVRVNQPVQAALRDLVPVMWDDDTVVATPDHTAVVVFDRERGVNGREEAFFKPQPEQLPSLAASLFARGVRHLLVVMPHSQGGLPDALKRGLASLDEHTVATLGFEHLVFMRSAQAPSEQQHSHPAQRLAHWMLSQLQMMVPQRERPVRASKVAEFAAQLAAQLPGSPPGTRVVPPELVWAAAQTSHVRALATRWLNDPPPPETPPPPSRL